MSTHTELGVIPGDASVNIDPSPPMGGKLNVYDSQSFGAITQARAALQDEIREAAVTEYERLWDKKLIAQRHEGYKALFSQTFPGLSESLAVSTDLYLPPSPEPHPGIAYTAPQVDSGILLSEVSDEEGMFANLFMIVPDTNRQNFKNLSQILHQLGSPALTHRNSDQDLFGVPLMFDRFHIDRMDALLIQSKFGLADGIQRTDEQVASENEVSPETVRSAGQNVTARLREIHDPSLAFAQSLRADTVVYNA